MQSLDIISVNIWSILISLANLVILFFIIKKFLYKPVKTTLEKRRAEIDAQYENAQQAEEAARQNQEAWEQKMVAVKKESDDMIADAAKVAQTRADRIVADAKEQADYLVEKAKRDVALERQNADADIRREIVDVSTLLAEKLLEREVSAEDHGKLIDSFIDGIGDDHD